jgi:peptide/nickel transport system substrate-binding protein
MTMAFNSIRNPAAFDKEGRVQKATGTGPFKLGKWSPGQEIILDRNDDYWGGRPALDRIIFKIIPDPETRIMALEAGQIDLTFGQALSPTHIQLLKHNPRIKMLEQVSTNSSVIFFNTRKEPFNDVRVRQAIHHGVDVPGLVSGLLGEVATPAQFMFSEAFKTYRNPDSRMATYDPGKARRILAEAGWKDPDADGILRKEGQRLSMTMTYDVNNAEYRLLAEPIQAQLKSIGVEVKLNKVEFGVYYELLRNKKFDLLLVGQWYIPHDDPWQVYKNYFTAKGFSSVAEDPEVDQLVGQLERELEDGKRLHLHHALQKVIMSKSLGIYLFYNKNLWPMAKKVQNFSPYMDFWRQYKPLEKTRIE